MNAYAAAVVVLVSLASNAAAQDPPRIALTLDQATSRALESSHRLEEAGARQQAAIAAADAREAARRPIVAAQAGYTRTNHVDEFGLQTPGGQLRVIYPDVPDNYRSRLDVSWPLYTGGRLEAFASAAAHETRAASSDIDVLRGDLRLEVARAYWTLIGADETLRTVSASRERIAAHVGNARNALAAGLVAPNEVSTAEAQEARQRMLVVQAQSTRQIAEAELARLVGLPPGTAIDVGPAVESAPLDADLAALVATALAARRDREALVERRSAADDRIDAALRARRPMVAAGGGVDYANPNPRIFPRQEAWKTSWDASVNVSLSLFDGGRAKAEAAEASAGRKALDARLAELDSMIALDIRQRLAEIEASVAAQAAATASQGAARESQRVVGDRYAAGVAIGSDVLDAEDLVQQASLDITRAVVAREIAKARIRRALGQ